MSKIAIRVENLGNRYGVGQRERYMTPRDTRTKAILPIHFAALPRRLDARLKRREAIAARYHQAFAALPEVRLAPTRLETRHAWHIYPLRLNRDRLRRDRETIFQALRAENIGVSVHYQPVHLHPYYRERLGTGPGLCPAAEAAFEDLITLPLFPGMSDGDVADVIHAVEKVMRWARK